MSDPHWLDGRPYYCETCGLGYAEFLACDQGDCQLESLEAAIVRALEAEANKKKGRGK